MPSKSNQRVAVVTGAGRAEGIGFEVCRQLAVNRTTVFLTARSFDQAASLASTLSAEGLDVRPFAVDVTQDDNIQRLASHITDVFGKLDILINNATGVARLGERAATADLAVSAEVMQTTLFGAWRMCQAMIPLLRQSAAPRIVNVSSGTGSHGDSAGLGTQAIIGASYAVSKAALNALTVKLAYELRPNGILVNAVCPGFTATFPGAEAMGGRPVRDGAASVVWAAMLDSDGPTGGFFRDGKPVPW